MAVRREPEKLLFMKHPALPQPASRSHNARHRPLSAQEAASLHATLSAPRMSDSHQDGWTILLYHDFAEKPNVEMLYSQISSPIR